MSGRRAERGALPHRGAGERQQHARSGGGDPRTMALLCRAVGWVATTPTSGATGIAHITRHRPPEAGQLVDELRQPGAKQSAAAPARRRPWPGARGSA